jgi:hypothetical protein
MALAILRGQRGEARASSTLALACLTICERPFALPMPTSTCDNPHCHWRPL